MSTKKKYAFVGTGSRAHFFYLKMFENHRNECEIVAICDTNTGRMQKTLERFVKYGGEEVPTYLAKDFEKMIEQHKPDTIIVTSGPDATHKEYICKAMEMGCDVISEKPLTIDEESCSEIAEIKNRTKKDLKVAFNYRYSPPRSQIKEMIQGGAIGKVLSVNFTWMLDTRHGADYFRRWHRQCKNSGSLLTHKSTHHFDLVNWWLDDIPEEVFCHGTRNFYCPEMGDELGLQDRGENCRNCSVKDKCKFYLDLNSTEDLRDLYLKHEHLDGYIRDKCVFGEGIDIWDTMSLSAKYKQGAVLSYLLNTYSPYEGYEVAFNGTKGRIEHKCCEDTYISGDGTIPGELQKDQTSITLIPEFSQPQIIEVKTGEGGHGGGDPILASDLFSLNPEVDPLKRAAGLKDGAYSILLGTAARKSIQTGQAVKVNSLIKDPVLLKNN